MKEDPTKALDLSAHKRAVNPALSTYEDEVLAAAAWGDALRTMLAASGKPPLAPERPDQEVKADAPIASRGSGARISVRSAAAAPPAPACTCPPGACDTMSFQEADGSWSLGFPPPKALHAAAFRGWRDLRTIDTKDDPPKGDLSFHMSWSFAPGKANTFSLVPPVVDQSMFKISGLVMKNPFHAWESARVVVNHYVWLWIFDPAHPLLPVATPILQRTILDVHSWAFEGNKPVSFTGNLWAFLPAAIAHLVSDGSTVHLKSEIDLSWWAVGGASVRFKIDEFTVRTTDIEKTFAMCD